MSTKIIDTSSVLGVKVFCEDAAATVAEKGAGLLKGKTA